MSSRVASRSFRAASVSPAPFRAPRVVDSPKVLLYDIRGEPATPTPPLGTCKADIERFQMAAMRASKQDDDPATGGDGALFFSPSHPSPELHPTPEAEPHPSLEAEPAEKVRQ